MFPHRPCVLTVFGMLVLFSLSALAEDNKTKTDKKASKDKIKLVPTTLAEGAIQLKVPSHWKAKKLSPGILEKEYSIPAAKGDKVAGRLTMMKAGGSVNANIERWYGQFEQPDKKATRDVAKVDKMKVNGQECVIVDISGTFGERVGTGPPFTRKLVQRENYRMLGGIVQTKTKEKFQYFFKLYGPKKTVDAAEKHFKQMVASVTPK